MWKRWFNKQEGWKEQFYEILVTAGLFFVLMGLVMVDQLEAAEIDNFNERAWEYVCKESRYHCERYGIPVVVPSPVLEEFHAVGYYFTGQDAVFINPMVVSSEAGLMATLVHEHIHYLQDQAGWVARSRREACVMEGEAWNFSNQWLSENGHHDRVLIKWWDIYDTCMEGDVP